LFDIGGVARFALFIAPEHENLAQMLDAFAAHLLADFGQIGFARLAFVGLHAHFDQRMRRQCQIDFVQNGGRNPVLTDHDHRVKMMCGGAQGAAGAGGEGGVGGHRGLSFSSDMSLIISRLAPFRGELAA
jgi:hypothetical protein